MTKRCIAVLLAFLLVLVASGAAAYERTDSPDASADLVLAEDTAADDLMGDNDLPGDGESPDDPGAADDADDAETVEYELKLQSNCYAFNMVCPKEIDNPIAAPVFTSGAVVLKGTSTECTEPVQYAWYAASTDGMPEGSVLGTEASFSVANDPAYAAGGGGATGRSGAHYYVLKVSVNDVEVGS